MANFNDLAAKMGDYFAEHKQEIFTQLLVSPSLDDHFELEANVADELATLNFSMEASAKNFKYEYTATDTQKFTASKLKVRPGLIAEVIYPKEYYKTYLNQILKKVYTPEAIPFEKMITDEMIRVNLNGLRTKTIWKGVYDAAPATPTILTIFDGFEKHLLDGVTASTIVPLTAVGIPTEANILDAVDEVIEGMSEEVKSQPDVQVLLSAQLFFWYLKAYKVANQAHLPERDAEGNIIYDLDPRIKIKSEKSLTAANSKRILGSIRRNMQIGTSAANFENFNAIIHSHGLYFDILLEFEMGTQIPWPEYLTCNNAT